MADSSIVVRNDDVCKSVCGNGPHCVPCENKIHLQPLCGSIGKSVSGDGPHREMCENKIHLQPLCGSMGVSGGLL